MSAPPETGAEKPLLTVAVSSRALFNFEEENKIFKEQGEAAYMEKQRDLLESVATPGVAFPMVKKLLALNADGEPPLVEVAVVSRNDPVTGLRVFRAIGENKLNIRRGCFTRGAPSFPYLRAFDAQLFLSALESDVREALAEKIPAAHVIGGNADSPRDDSLRIAFDGDAVLFGDESERVFQHDGLRTFQEQEEAMAQSPLSPGPLKPFMDALANLRARRPGRIRTALVTSRGAPAHERPIRTLREWNIDVDETFFLAGMKKRDILRAFRADFFFDDQIGHLQEVPGGGHVSFGVKNEP